MDTFQLEDCAYIYPACRAIVGGERWDKITLQSGSLHDPESLTRALMQSGEEDMPQYLPDLARLEYTLHEMHISSVTRRHDFSHTCLNPTARLVELSWKNLLPLLNRDSSMFVDPEPGKELVLVWKDPRVQKAKCRVASRGDLLAMKIVEESIEPELAAEEGKVTVGFIDAILDEAVHDGILLAPPSQIRRDPSIFSANEYVDKRFLTSHSFTLQWHITQACDLHCRHCYDRSTRSPMPLEQGLRILDDLRGFCRERHVMKAVSFTGGNPFLYPRFLELYRAASERGFSIGILGNPTAREHIEALISVQKPTHFQVSLEGLEAQDDFIRGKGHFRRTIEFLDLLKDLGIFSMVMLTLTKTNMNDIIPLAEILNDRADRFHFNRLSMVGEGAHLSLPEKEDYLKFLDDYEKAVQKYPVLGLKDNLLSIRWYQRGCEPFGGCTMFGCGAAFSFLAVLSDGKVHACRKFPSPLGNVFHQSLADIYDSPQAERYRAGCKACHGCKLLPVCGGCLAVAQSLGQNIFEKKDPFCFLPGN